MTWVSRVWEQPKKSTIVSFMESLCSKHTRGFLVLALVFFSVRSTTSYLRGKWGERRRVERRVTDEEAVPALERREKPSEKFYTTVAPPS